MAYPELIGTVIDAVDSRRVADFWGELLGLRYRRGDEPPPEGVPDPQADDWLVLCDDGGRARLAVQAVDELSAVTWPDPDVPQQLHLDLMVPSKEELVAQRERVVGFGGRILDDRVDSSEESIIVFADPAGHPFCILVSPTATVPNA